MSSIRLHSKYGVNPTIAICFWCEKDKNEIALLGAATGRLPAPKHMLIDYDPCDECKANFALGVVVICVSTTPNFKNQRQWSEKDKIYPTGQWSVVKEDAEFLKAGGPGIHAQIMKHKKCFMLEMEYNQMGFNEPEAKAVSDVSGA